ncbi:MAG: polysaccharide deacetylase family protein [Ignavibacteria bacterium]|nr:polysaccharide deacetylase family protein [Ignavibacteria bacterium]
MNINFLCIDLDGKIKNRLTENDFENKFSTKQKVYYNFIRPFVPITIRQKIQEKVNARIKWKKDFIDASLVAEVIELQSDIVTKLKYKNDKDCAIVLTHDVEEQEGFNFIPKVIELEEKYGFKSSWNIVPYKYKIDEGIIKLIRETGHEIGIHGYNHDGKLYYSEKIFNERVPFINEALKKYNAVGFRSPMVHRNLKWLQKLNIEYDASCFDYDPFQPFPGGTGSIWPFIAGKFVELPYTLPQDHTIFYVLKQKDISIWKNKAEWIAKNKGVILIITHPDYLQEKKHFELYKQLLIHLKTYKNAWSCLPKELSQFWRNLITIKKC